VTAWNEVGNPLNVPERSMGMAAAIYKEPETPPWPIKPIEDYAVTGINNCPFHVPWN
jgi:hypothetical protein